MKTTFSNAASISEHYLMLKEFTLSKFKETSCNSILGSLWNLINPLLMLLVLYLAFSARFGQSIQAYPAFLLVGIVCVGFFTTAVGQTLPLLAWGKEMMINTTVSPACIMLSELIFLIFRFLIEIGLCLIFSLIYGVFSWDKSFALIGLLIAYSALIIGVSLMLSLVYCIVRDISHIWNFVGKVLLFATPVFYPLKDLSEWAGRLIYWSNPLTPFVLSFREIFVTGGQINSSIYIHSLGLGAIFLALGVFLFSRFSQLLIERA